MLGVRMAVRKFNQEKALKKLLTDAHPAPRKATAVAPTDKDSPLRRARKIVRENTRLIAEQRRKHGMEGKGPRRIATDPRVNRPDIRRSNLGRRSTDLKPVTPKPATKNLASKLKGMSRKAKTGFGLGTAWIASEAHTGYQRGGIKGAVVEGARTGRDLTALGLTLKAGRTAASKSAFGRTAMSVGGKVLGRAVPAIGIPLLAKDIYETHKANPGWTDSISEGGPFAGYLHKKRTERHAKKFIEKHKRRGK